MISTNEFKNGICVEYEGDIYQVMEFQHVKPGKGQAFVRSKIKNMRSGAIKEFAFQPGLKLKLVVIEKKIMQYLYIEPKSLKKPIPGDVLLIRSVKQSLF